MGNLGRVGQAAGNGASALVLEGVEGVGPTLDFGAILENGLYELFGDGAASDLIKVFDLGKELAATSMKLSGGGALHM